ncbi:hypothetical protein MJO29_008746, partial [Puccinia striiformis f. sp. tritici]
GWSNRNKVLTAATSDPFDLNTPHSQHCHTLFLIPHSSTSSSDSERGELDRWDLTPPYRRRASSHKNIVFLPSLLIVFDDWTLLLNHQS